MRLRTPNTGPSGPQVHLPFQGQERPDLHPLQSLLPREADGAGPAEGLAVSEPSCCTDVRGWREAGEWG